jgi:hypothetical protein
MIATRSKAKTASRKRTKRIRGICRAATDLGVNRDHLRMVLRGERQSLSLLRRFANWKSTAERRALKNADKNL